MTIFLPKTRSAGNTPWFEAGLCLGDLPRDVGEVASEEIPDTFRVGDAVKALLGVHLDSC